MTGLVERLKADLSDRYVLERVIGEGGMATVISAVDRKHDRRVAIKVLRPELATAVGLDRFLREIKVAAALRHPHILPLFDSGEADGLLYYVMPFVEGESLRARMARDGRLGLDEALEVARDVAGALEYAHRHGVVHRDIKPDNIMLEGGRAVVADFGIAQALMQSDDERLTATGQAIGTPAYMSPEQALANAPVDERTDVYALGCVVHEMLSGDAPFMSPTLHPEVAAGSAEASLRLSASLPDHVVEAIRRALSVTPSGRYPSADAFAAALQGRSGSRVRWRGARGIVVGSVAAVTLLLGGWWLLQGGSDLVVSPVRIAVLPFENQSGVVDDAFFAEGIGLDVSTQLTKLSAFTVVVPGFTRSGTAPIAEIGRELGVEYLVTGSVRRAGDAVRVTVALVDPSDGSQPWSQGYDRALSLANLLAIQRDISENVAASLNAAISPEEQARIDEDPTTQLEAWSSYQYGRFHWNKRTPDGLQRAVEHFLEATRVDPEYALAYAGLADAYVLFPKYGVSSLVTDSAYARAEQAARTALRLDPELGEAHAAVGLLYELAHQDWRAAHGSFETAIRLRPDYATAHQWYGEHLLSRGATDSALAELRRATMLEPLSLVARNALSLALYVSRAHRDALDEVERVLEIDPSFAPARLIEAGSYLALDSVLGFGRALEAAGVPQAVRNPVVDAIATPVARGDAIRAIGQARPPLPVLQATLLYAAIDVADSVISELQRAIDSHSSDLVTLFTPLPVIGDIVSDPRYRQLARAIGLEPIR